MPGTAVTKACWTRGAALAAAEAPIFSSLPSVKTLDNLQKCLNSAMHSAGHSQGGPLVIPFEGHTASARFRVGSTSASFVLSRQADPNVQKACSMNTNGPVQLLRRWMRRQGFKEVDARTWRHPLSCHSLAKPGRHLDPLPHQHSEDRTFFLYGDC